MDDKTLINTMLLDFYGDVLTEKQREYLSLYYNNDLTLSEIADDAGISRQGVHDIITRAEKKLMALENKTGIIQKWSETRIALERVILDGGEVHPVAREYFLL